jgi:PilZ domain
MRLTTSERRGHPRRALIRPCKVRVAKSGKFVAASTRDVSSGGALLVLDRRANLTPGDEIEFGIAWNSGVIIRADEMAHGRVVRVVAEGGQTESVAVALTAQQRAALAA